MLQYPLPLYPKATYERGFRIMSHLYQRELPEAKTINYITGIRILQDLKKAGADDVIYHDGGILRESARSNIFFLSQEDILVTPSEKILKGITRENIIQLAQGFLKVELREATLEELYRAKEAFFTSSIKSVLPVVQVDEHLIGAGKPGKVTQQLQEKFQQLTQHYIKTSRSLSSL